MKIVVDNFAVLFYKTKFDNYIIGVRIIDHSLFIAIKSGYQYYLLKTDGT